MMPLHHLEILEQKIKHLLKFEVQTTIESYNKKENEVLIVKKPGTTKKQYPNT